MKGPTARSRASLQAMAEVIGSSGLRVNGGFVTEEFLPELRGARGARTYREMVDNEATIGGVIFAISTLIRQAQWTVQAANESDEGLEGKAFLEECLADMTESLEVMIAEICSMFIHGYAPMEMTFKVRRGDQADPLQSSIHSDGKVGFAAIELRSQSTISRWDLDDATGRVLGMFQQPFTGPEIRIPIEKLLLFRTTAERGNPEGRSILRSAYRAWFFKRRIEEIEAVGVERDLAGLPVVSVPGRYFAKDADPHERSLLLAWQKLVTSIRRDQREGIVMPSDRDSNGNPLFELKLLSSGGSRTFDTSRIVDRYSRAMATSVLADFIFLGQQAVGSFALSSDKTALFAAALGAFTKDIAATFNRVAIPLLWRLNGMPRETMPKLTCGDLENPNIAELAGYISTLAGAGATMFPDRELENHLRSIAGLPLVPEDDGGISDDPTGGTLPGDEDDEDAE